MAKTDFWKDKDYQARKLAHDVYEVTSWGRGDTPDKIYTIHFLGDGKWKCNCPARKITCKHIDMVKELKKKDDEMFKAGLLELKTRLEDLGVDL